MVKACIQQELVLSRLQHHLGCCFFVLFCFLTSISQELLAGLRTSKCVLYSVSASANLVNANLVSGTDFWEFSVHTFQYHMSGIFTYGLTDDCSISPKSLLCS